MFASLQHGASVLLAAMMFLICSFTASVTLIGNTQFVFQISGKVGDAELMWDWCAIVEVNV